MKILEALGFMVMGGLVVWCFERHAWLRYRLGLREGAQVDRGEGVPARYGSGAARTSGRKGA